MAVFDNFPYTNLHELNLDFILKSTGEVKQLAADTKEIADQSEELLERTNELVTDLDSRIEGLVDVAVDEYMETNPVVQEAIENVLDEGIVHSHAVMPTQIYIACNTGSDDNDGMSNTTPFRTMQKALNWMNRHSAAGWFNLIEPGTYTINTPRINACQMHITARAADVTIDWLDNDTNSTLKAFYNCYIHLEGYGESTDPITTIFNARGSASGDFYIEAGKMYANRINFKSNTNFGLTGADGTFMSCIFNTSVTVGLSTSNFNGCTWENIPAAVNTDCCLGASVGSNVSVAYSATFNNIDASVRPYLVKGARASLILTGHPTVTNSTGVTYGYFDRCIISGNQGVTQDYVYQNGYVENCTVLGKWYGSGTNQAGFDSILITEDAIKGEHYNYDKNAKGLAFRFRLMNGSSVAAVWNDYMDLSLKRDSVMEWNSAGMMYRGSATSNIPTYVWIRYQTDFASGQPFFHFLQTYGVNINDTTSIHAGTYTIKVEVREVFY